MWRGLAVVVLVLTGVALLPQSASACSCAYGDPREMLANGDAAFVGKLVDREEPSSGGITSSADEVTYTFAIEQVVKGDLGEMVEVESPISGASCGFEVGMGQRTGVVLYRDGGTWTGGLCSQVDADALIRASQPIPPPDGEGPVALLMANSPNNEEIVALDAAGRVLAYIESATGSRIERMAVCPGSERVVEFVFEGQFPRLAVRNLRTLEVERILRPDGLVPEVRAMECLTPDGATVLLHETNYLERGGETRIIRVQGEESTIVYEATITNLDYLNVAFDAERGLAYTVDPEIRFRVLAVDLETGESAVIAQIGEPDGDFGGIYEMEVNSSGTRLAVAAELPKSATFPSLFLIDLTSDPATVVRVGDESYSFTNPSWVAEDRLITNGYRDNAQDVLIYDGSGSLVRTISDLWLEPVAARQDVVYGIGYQGTGGSFPSLFSITLPDGEPVAIRPIDRSYVSDLVAMPGDIEIEATAAPPSEATAMPTSTSTSESTTPPAESTATPDYATATPVESGQVGSADNPPDPGVVAASTDSGSGIGMEELAVGGLALGVVALGGWLVLRRRRHAEPVVGSGP